MNRTLRLLPLFLLATCLSAATKIRSYQMGLDIKPDGTATATATLTLDTCVPGTLVVPVGFASVTGLKVDNAPAGVRLDPAPKAVRLQLPEGVAPACTVTFSFPVAKAYKDAPKGNTGEKPLAAANRVLAFALVNTQETAIDAFRLDVRLPEGMMVQTIREQLPKLGKTEAGPRVRLNKVDGRQGGFLQLSPMAQGDSTALTLELTPTRKSPLWLLVGLLLGGLYLFFFRDLVAAKAA